MRVLLLITFIALALFAPATCARRKCAERPKLFEDYGCYQCHGREAQGGSGTGRGLGPKPMPFPAVLKPISGIQPDRCLRTRRRWFRTRIWPTSMRFCNRSLRHRRLKIFRS